MATFKRRVLDIKTTWELLAPYPDHQHADNALLADLQRRILVSIENEIKNSFIFDMRDTVVVPKGTLLSVIDTSASLT